MLDRSLSGGLEHLGNSGPIPVSVRPGSCDRTPPAGWIIALVSYSPGGQKAKLKAPADLVSGGDPLPSSQTATFLPHPHVGMGEGPRGVSRVRALIPFVGLQTPSHGGQDFNT